MYLTTSGTHNLAYGLLISLICLQEHCKEKVKADYSLLIFIIACPILHS